MEEKYQACLRYMYQKLPMFTRVGSAAYKPNLDNIIKLCEALGNPHLKFKSIHIGGTNGKGSTSHLIASVLHENGYKTGLYTSPHVLDFRERIKINGQEVPKEYVVQFIDKMKAIIEKQRPSFFEITVAMAFDYFAKEQIDIAVIEVGLGGLLDSTNIITPILSVITNISKDHTNLLGNTIEEIALQKAGIIKHQVPIVIGETQPEIEKIFFSKSIQKESPIVFADKIFKVVHSVQVEQKQFLKIVDLTNETIEVYGVDLLGNYQQKNVQTVLASLEVLKSLGIKLTDNKIKLAIANCKNNTRFLGRFEIVKTDPTIIFDVSHNEAGMLHLMQQLKNMSYNKLHIILAFVSDKEVEPLLNFLPLEAQYYITQAQIPRAMHLTHLYDLIIRKNLQAISYDTITLALKQATLNAQADDIIILTGSFYNLEEGYTFLKN